jgi:hypothetical protein
MKGLEGAAKRGHALQANGNLTETLARLSVPRAENLAGRLGSGDATQLMGFITSLPVARGSRRLPQRADEHRPAAPSPSVATHPSSAVPKIQA